MPAQGQLGGLMIMVPEQWVNYFQASIQASAALVGLLFVAVAVAPERIFGREATPKRRALAGSAFTALLNAFFISLVAVTPRTNLGYVTLVMGLIGFFNTLRLGRHFWGESHKRVDYDGVIVVLGSLVIYGLEIWFAVALLRRPHDPGNVENVVDVLLAIYALGFVRAWELLGAQNERLFGLLGLRRASNPTNSDASVDGDTEA